MIYIRHGDDSKPDPIYPNDPSLIKESCRSIKKLTWELIQKFGRPDAIYVSPMRRAWETALVMEKIFHQQVPLLIDPHLSRYFTRSERNHNAVRSDTLKRKAPVYESKQKFESRIGQHVDHLSPCYSTRRPLVWCVTHALVLKRIGKIIGLKLKDHFEFLETFIVESQPTKVIR